MAYTSVADVEEFLQVTFTTETIPTLAQVTTKVADIDSEVDSITGTSWTIQNKVEYKDLPNYTNKFLVDKFPLVTVNSISYNTGTEFVPVWTAFTNNRTMGDLIITNTEVKGDNKVQIDYDYGFATVPSDVKRLAYLLVSKQIMNSSDASNTEFNSVSVGGLSITTAIGSSKFTNIDKNIQSTLNQIGKYKAILK